MKVLPEPLTLETELVSACEIVRLAVKSPPPVRPEPADTVIVLLALVPMLVAVVVAKFGSSPKAAASSLSVSSVPGAASTSASTLSCALASALASV